VREPNTFAPAHGGNRANVRQPRQYKPSDYEARQPPAARSKNARYEEIRQNRLREYSVDARGNMAANVALPMDVEDW